MDKSIRFAIENKRMISLYYKDLYRIVEPYVFGLHKSGQQVLYGFQAEGESLFGEDGWRMFELFQIRDVHLMNHRFFKKRLGWEMGKAGLKTIFCEI